MQYSSTNRRSPPVSFREAALRGLADDGGLFMPAEIPRLPSDFWERCGALSFAEVALAVAEAFLADDIPSPALRAIVEETLAFDAPLVHLSPDLHILELFHGPTLAFKDFGARFMARVVSHLRRDATPELTVLVATSGDTGSAVAHGFRDVPGTRVVLLYPGGKVSRIQEQQLTTAGGNVTALEVEGTFDDCQRMVKQAFLDPELQRRLVLTSANSINIARLIPQIFYYAYGVGRLQDRSVPLVVSVPSGNFGNLTAGLIARRMGLPVTRFIAATNANDVVPQYLRTGRFHPRPSRQTLSSAMDVGDPSNFARMLALYDHDAARLGRAIRAYGVTDDETAAAMRELFDRHRYVADPHTAVGYRGLARYREERPSPVQGIVLATAHPAKFLDSCPPALRGAVDVPDQLRASLEKRKEALQLPNRYEALREVLLRPSARSGAY
jgi:threonine synthase